MRNPLYQNPPRVRRRITLGSYGALTVDQAREATKRLLGRVSSGEDPAGEASLAKESARKATVALISAEYLADLAGKIKPRTADEYARLFKVNIVPVLGRKPIRACDAERCGGTPFISS